MWRFSFLVVIWSIWKERNYQCSDNNSSIEVVTHKVKFSSISSASMLPFLGSPSELITQSWREAAVHQIEA